MFRAGDILVAASDVPEDADFRDLRGPGRVLHFDAHFNPRTTLETGTGGLVIGVAVDPKRGFVYAADAQAKRIVRFDHSGSRDDDFVLSGPAAKYGSLAFNTDGICFLGVHNRLGEQNTTNGGFTLARWDPGRDSIRSMHTEIDGGKLGFHCISHLSVDPTTEIVRYVSENGRRILQYDVAAQEQLNDLFVLPDDDPRGTYGLDHTPDGNVIMATGDGVGLFGVDGHEIHQVQAEPTRGWSRVRMASNGESFFLNNFLNGTIQHRRLEDFSIVQQHNIGQSRCLCGIDQYPKAS